MRFNGAGGLKVGYFRRLTRIKRSAFCTNDWDFTLSNDAHRVSYVLSGCRE